MQTVRSVLPRLLHDRRAMILIFAAVAIAVVACRGSGSDPSPGDQGLPVINPTPSRSECIDHVQPAGAPTFAELDLSLLQTQEEGLRFYDIEAGSGDTPNLADAVSVEYTGWLDNGCMFDTSYPNEGPTNFIMLNVIPGWQRALVNMQEGGTRVIEIGPSLAYRDIGFPPRIPPNATLIFHLNLINRVTIAEAQATIEAERAAATAEAEDRAATIEAGGNVFAETCQNDRQPDDAPNFEDIDFDRFETLVDGVRFYDLEAGSGETPDSSDAVTVEYTGWLTDGCIFDTSYDEEGPISFPLANLIRGWQEGIGAMQVGGTRVIEIAPEFAYGERGSGATIPPDATIIFHVELLDKQ